MDFIEKIFGISPDGGSGSFEVALLLAPVLLVAALVIARRRNRVKF
jgi:MYXO-CTERM domain-containing protein